MAKGRKVIITCAVTGSIHTPSMSPHLPLTPEDIAQQSIDAAEAGVAVAGVAEAADENPFQHVLPPVPHVPLHFPLHFQGVTALNDGRNDPC